MAVCLYLSRYMDDIEDKVPPPWEKPLAKKLADKQQAAKQEHTDLLKAMGSFARGAVHHRHKKRDIGLARQSNIEMEEQLKVKPLKMAQAATIVKGTQKWLHRAKARIKIDCFVHREVDVPASRGSTVGESDSSFCAKLVAELKSLGIEAQAEPEEAQEERHDHRRGATAPSAAVAKAMLERAGVAIFLLSDNFFHDERSISLLRHAVELQRSCLMVVMPGARWGGKKDKAFPENAFNPAWIPYCPEVAPAFAEIAVTWESHYQFACLEELVKRIGAHLEKLGVTTVDTEAARNTLAAQEDEYIKTAMNAQPSEVKLKWDWDSKKFDVFLSRETSAHEPLYTAVAREPLTTRMRERAVAHALSRTRRCRTRQAHALSRTRRCRTRRCRMCTVARTVASRTHRRAPSPSRTRAHDAELDAELDAVLGACSPPCSTACSQPECGFSNHSRDDR